MNKEKMTILELMQYIEESQKQHDEWLAALTPEQRESYWVMVEDGMSATVH